MRKPVCGPAVILAPRPLEHLPILAGRYQASSKRAVHDWSVGSRFATGDCAPAVFLIPCYV